MESGDRLQGCAQKHLGALCILFARPNRQLYLEIIRELAAQYRSPMPIAELETKAEAFALARGTRSARCAEQFIESLM